MKLNELEIGKKLELEIFTEEGEKLDQMLISKLEWLEGLQEAVIAAPIFEGNIFPIRIGTMLTVYFTSRLKSDVSLFKVNAVVKSREMSENLHLLRIELLEEIKKEQRRMYYRLNCSVKVQYKQVDTFNAEENSDIPYKKTIANNLSGGGINLFMEEKLEVGSILQCEIVTEQSKKIKFFGKILRYDESGIEGKFKYQAGIAYIQIDNNDREAVVQYIFREQQKLRKRGLI